MTRRRLFAIASAPTLLTLLSVSVDRGRTLRVLTFDGTPVNGYFVIYHYEGSRPNPVHPISYEASPRFIAQSDSAGSVQIASSVHVHWPFPIETHPRITVDLVYAPIQHNGHATIVESAVAKPGIFEVAADLATVKVADVSGSPALREGTLRNLSWIIGRMVEEQSRGGSRRQARPETAALIRVLAAQFVKEYEAFLKAYGDIARPRPEMPGWLQTSSDKERSAWNEMVDKDLANEPLWGDVAHRLFAHEAERFARVESGLK